MTQLIQKQSPEVFYKETVVKNWQYSEENTSVLASFY